MKSESKQTKVGKILGKLNANSSFKKETVVGSGKKVIASQKPNDSSIKTLTDLGDMIKYKRTKSKLSIKRTAMLCGISDKTLRSIENGENANTSTIFTIINMLGLKLRLEE
ncbi:helix-turn-helix domain-containing protein [Sulfurimonas sp.]|uniref:helix-turn-helix domain-containing protein n=1 Tax=Sulfurimonas sp. TaxID=2022749 RepID=UPI0035661399